MLFSGLENHALAQRFFGMHVANYYDRLADHVEALMKVGRLRRADPLLAARGFLGMVVYHSWIQDVFGGKHFREYSLREASRTLAGIWLEGMRPQKGLARRDRASSARKVKSGKGRSGHVHT
jgi:hypothetical protein